MRFGKTESWIILEAEPGAAVHVGPREPLDPATVRGWVERQDADEMLAALQRVPVAAGDAVLVPAGTLHAIGAGILLLELQEPTDLSVLVEWKPFGVDRRLGAPRARLGDGAAGDGPRARRHRRADRRRRAATCCPTPPTPTSAPSASAAATSSGPRSRSCW